MIVGTEAVARLVYADGALLGTGFAVEGGLIVTCAHLLGEGRTRPTGEMTAHFANGTAVRCRVAADGWFPQTRERLADEPDALCDVAILAPAEKVVGMPSGLVIGPQNPASDAKVFLTGYPVGGQEQKEIAGTVQGDGLAPGALTVTRGVGSEDIAFHLLSGAPALHGETGVVVGMLAHRPSERPDKGQLVSVEPLRRAVTAVGHPAVDGAILVLYDDGEPWHANAGYASSSLHSPTQDQKPGRGVRVRLEANFSKPSKAYPRLRQIRVAVELPDDRLAEGKLGQSETPCGSPEVLVKRVAVGHKKSAWVVRAAGGGDLHDRNVAPDAPLFSMPDAVAGDRLTMRMTALADPDHFHWEKIVPCDGAVRKLEGNKSKIMNRIRLKAIEGAGYVDSGEILLSSTRHVVRQKT